MHELADPGPAVEQGYRIPVQQGEQERNLFAMSLAAAFLLAAAVAQTASADTPSEPDRGAQVATARIGATILRSAMLQAGSLVIGRDGAILHSQRQSRDGRITYEFEYVR